MYSVGMRVIDCFQGHIINSITFQPYVFGVAAQVFFFFLAKDMVWLNLYTTNQKSPIGQSPWVDYNFLHL